MSTSVDKGNSELLVKKGNQKKNVSKVTTPRRSARGTTS